MPTPLDERLARLQTQVTEANLDGWLIYDFRGSNPFAARLLGLAPGLHLTRRFFVWVPREGSPVVLHNAIEGGVWRRITAGSVVETIACAGHAAMTAALAERVRPGMRVAMEYSERCAVPYVSRVDAGTVEQVRALGAEVFTSADLMQEHLRWSDEDLAAHLVAADGVVAARDAGFRLIHERLKAGEPVDELTVQAEIMGTLAARGLIADHPAIVGFGAHAGDPHHSPNPDDNPTLQPGQCVLIDLWAQVPDRPYADITWMGCAGAPSAELLRTWEVVRDARDAAVALLQSGYEGREGWEADRAARQVFIDAGLADAFTHRLGHSLGIQAVHGDAANLDDFEAHDTRKLMRGIGVTIEPGAYLPERGIGVRSEINVYFAPSGAEVTTPLQRNLLLLGEGDWPDVLARAMGD
jgi:Xaa-Pro aminopeptidase